MAVGDGSTLFKPPSCFSLNNPETVKAVTLTFFRDIHAKFRNPNPPQSVDIGQKSDGGFPDFRISVQSL